MFDGLSSMCTQFSADEKNDCSATQARNVSMIGVNSGASAPQTTVENHAAASISVPCPMLEMAVNDDGATNNITLNDVRETPTIPRHLPKTLVALVEQHIEMDLEKFKHEQKSHWPGSTSMAYSRRAYLFQSVAALAQTLRGDGNWHQKLKEAAIQMDRNRVVPLPKYHKQLKEKDDNFKHRDKRPKL